MKIGYSFWGCMGDFEIDKRGNLVKDADIHPFYSWSIVRELQLRGHEVIRMMPNFDTYAADAEGDGIFNSFCKDVRKKAYLEMNKIPFSDHDVDSVIRDTLFCLWGRSGAEDFDFIIHEWIGGDYFHESGSPKIFFQRCLVDYCEFHNIPLFIVDYKCDMSELEWNWVNGGNHKTWLFYTGNKWDGVPNTKRIEAPFMFRDINTFLVNEFSYKDVEPKNLVYVGKHTDFVCSFENYVPSEIKNVVYYTDKSLSVRNSSGLYSGLEVHDFPFAASMFEVYNDALATVLLNKPNCYTYGIVGFDLLQAIFYGTVPLFPCEYGEETIKKYVGIFSDVLTVRSKSDVIERIYDFKYNPYKRLTIIGYLRKRLNFMDVKYFVDDILEVL